MSSVTEPENELNVTNSASNSLDQEEGNFFFVELWESIFTPGTSPALLKATHGSFIILICLFVSLIVMSTPAIRFHFINLLLLTLVFYGVVIWFVRELEAVKSDEASKKKQ